MPVWCDRLLALCITTVPVTLLQATAPLLEADPTLWCISGWNDISQAIGFRWDAKRMVSSVSACCSRL